MNLKRIRLYLHGATDGKHIIEGWVTRNDETEPLFTEVVAQVTIEGVKVLPFSGDGDDGSTAGGVASDSQEIILEGSTLDVDFNRSRNIGDGGDETRADIQVSQDTNTATVALERI